MAIYLNKAKLLYNKLGGSVRKILLSIAAVWFLYIRAYALDSTIAIPMEDEQHCKAAIEVITQDVWMTSDLYYCLEAGYISR